MMLPSLLYDTDCVCVCICCVCVYMLCVCCRSCYVVFPCQQLVLCLGCLMGLVMFARYGEDSPLDKGYVKSNDQVT